MNIQEQIDEILGYFKEDCGYSAITGTIYKKDISDKFKRIEVENQSFNHTYGWMQSIGNMDDCFQGIIFIPIGNDVYVQCEWSS